jgi:DNA topoisomerase VI subunit B
LIVRELVDNSLDSCEEGGISPHIEIEITLEQKLIHLTVKDNGKGLNEYDINKIKDLYNLYSSRYHYKYPTRGAIGHFWKALFGISNTLYNSAKVEVVRLPITIISKGKRYDLRVAYTNNQYNVIPNITDVEHSAGTSVTVNLPILDEQWRDHTRLSRLVETFAYFNPHAKFTLVDQRYPPLEYPNLDGFHGLQRIRESIHWFSFDEFSGRVQSEAENKDKPPTPQEFVRFFRGLSDQAQLTNMSSMS